MLLSRRLDTTFFSDENASLVRFHIWKAGPVIFPAFFTAAKLRECAYLSITMTLCQVISLS